MTYFADLTPFAYGGADPDPTILNVGWLCRDHAMPIETPNEAFISALKKVTAAPINLYRGAHICDFCPPPPTVLSSGGIPMLEVPVETKGNGEVWVEGHDGVTYVAPTLVLHYVVSHHYSPPKAFVEAVIASG